jgi:hypothetical protein
MDHEPICCDKLDQAHFDRELDHALGFARSPGPKNAGHEITKRHELPVGASFHNSSFPAQPDDGLEGYTGAMGCYPHAKRAEPTSSIIH